jgi:hypothetical protein
MCYAIDVPAGTRCRLIDEGRTAGRYWIDDLSWVPAAQSILRHDAEHYGIDIDARETTPILPRGTWVDATARSIAKGCGVSVREARASRSKDTWDRDWMSYVATKGEPYAAVQPALSRHVWRGILSVCTSEAEARRWCRFHGFTSP